MKRCAICTQRHAKTYCTTIVSIHVTNTTILGGKMKSQFVLHCCPELMCIAAFICLWSVLRTQQYLMGLCYLACNVTKAPNTRLLLCNIGCISQCLNLNIKPKVCEAALCKKTKCLMEGSPGLELLCGTKNDYRNNVQSQGALELHSSLKLQAWRNDE